MHSTSPSHSFSHSPRRYRSAALFTVAAATACGGGGSVDRPPAATHSPLIAAAPAPDPSRVVTAAPAPPTTASPAASSVASGPVPGNWPGLPPLAAYTPAGTVSYAVLVTRRDTDLYELPGGLGYIETHRCQEPALGESATLTMSGFRGALRFDRSGTDCRVFSYFARASTPPSTYSATVGYHRSQWYALIDAALVDSYRAHTADCTATPDAQAAQVTIAAGQRGSFALPGDPSPTVCRIEQVYVQTPLP
jgi:hypothetical protein